MTAYSTVCAIFNDDFYYYILGTFTCGTEKDTRQLNELIVNMKEHPFNRTMDQYPCTWDTGHDPPQIAEASLHEFRDRVLEDLWKAIDFECPPLPPVNSLMLERQEHRLIQTSLVEHFASRNVQLAMIKTKLSASARNAVPLTIVAEPGNGKSALLARIVTDFVHVGKVRQEAETAARASSTHAVTAALMITDDDDVTRRSSLDVAEDDISDAQHTASVATSLKSKGSSSAKGSRGGAAKRKNSKRRQRRTSISLKDDGDLLNAGGNEMDRDVKKRAKDKTKWLQQRAATEALRKDQEQVFIIFHWIV